MRHYIARLGLELSPVSKPANSAEISEIMITVMELYEQMMNDDLLQSAAYGCAVGALSLTLDVSLRTAAMIFDDWRRRSKPDNAILVPTTPENPDGSQ
jgi:hypothetical protein